MRPGHLQHRLGPAMAINKVLQAPQLVRRLLGFLHDLKEARLSIADFRKDPQAVVSALVEFAGQSECCEDQESTSRETGGKSVAAQAVDRAIDQRFDQSAE